MIYFHVTVDHTGLRTWTHVNSRGRCTVCKVPLGVGECAECRKVAEAIDDIALAALRRLDSSPWMVRKYKQVTP